MGLFGVAELLMMAEGGSAGGAADRAAQAPRRAAAEPGGLARELLPILRGTGLGFFLGLLPGGGATLVVVHRPMCWSGGSPEIPERFGHGAIEGVAGPESANNAAAQSSFVPLLSLGIPANAVMGVILGALLVQGITPGPDAGRQPARPLLRRHRQHADRQPDADRAQRAADLDVRAASARCPARSWRR